MKKRVLPLLIFGLIGATELKPVQARGSFARPQRSIRPSPSQMQRRAHNRHKAVRRLTQPRVQPVRLTQRSRAHQATQTQRQSNPGLTTAANATAAPKLGWLRRTNEHLNQSTSTGARVFRLAKNGLKVVGAATLMGLGTAAALSSAPLGLVAAGLVGGGYYLAGRTMPHIANDLAGGTPFDKSFKKK